MGTRTRLKPEERQAQLLDCARDLVATDGVVACTIEAVSRSAGVTPQLVHTYFGTRLGLLEALYRREQEAFQHAIESALEGAETFEQIVRVFVTSNFDHLAAGTAIGALSSSPELADVIGESRQAEYGDAGRFLVRAMRKEYPAPTELLVRVLTMGSGASVAAADLAARTGADRDAAIDDTVRFIMAGLEALVTDR